MDGDEFREALRIQGRVLLALILREARTRYGRMRAGYLWALVQPILHISMFAVLLSSRWTSVPLGHSMVLFLATGFSVFFGFRNVMSRTQGGYGSNEALLSFPIVRIMDVFLARALLELATWLMVSFVLFSALILAGVAPLPYSVLTLLEAIFALFGIAFGAGLSIGIAAEFVPSLSSLMAIPQRLLYLGSGIFFLPERMPPFMRNIIDWNPIVHAITLFREGYYQGYESYMLDVRYLMSWSIGSILFGLVLERIARKPMRNLAT